MVLLEDGVRIRVCSQLDELVDRDSGIGKEATHKREHEGRVVGCRLAESFVFVVDGFGSLGGSHETMIAWIAYGNAGVGGNVGDPSLSLERVTRPMWLEEDLVIRTWDRLEVRSIGDGIEKSH